MKETKQWTQEECDYIIDNYTDMSDEEIADKLGRTMRAVRTKRQRLGLFRYFAENTEPIKGEIWREYRGYYVSNKGRVKKDGERFLKIHVHKTGYATLSFNGKLRYLHTIVWSAFMGEIPEGYEIDHIDCNKLNNALYNLELVTHSENMQRAYKNNCWKNMFGREPLTTIPEGSTPKQAEVPSTVA